MSCAPIFLISSEVKTEYWYDASERPIAIVPISARTKMLDSFDNFSSTIKDKRGMGIDKSISQNIREEYSRSCTSFTMPDKFYY
jgi:hypothetical protein